MRTGTNKLLMIAATAFFLASATAAVAGIVGSEHDFSGKGWSGGQICEVCHTPHNADTSVSDAPLWNHAVTTMTYSVYGSSTFDAIDSGQPDGNSKLCLSCHDGSIAIDAFGGGGGTTFLSGGEAVGANGLSDDHPLSFTYDSALATLDGELFDPSAQLSGLGSTIDDDMLFAGKVECASCHDVHDAAGNGDLLVKSNSGSALCLTCHDK